MTTTELKKAIEALFVQGWKVTINEQYMLNVQADEYERYAGFIYVEEFARKDVSYARYGRDVTHTHDVYFCVLGEFDTTAEQREEIREARIKPAVRAFEDAMAARGVTEFKEDYDPRGFDAHEILIHVQFKMKGKEC